MRRLTPTIVLLYGWAIGSTAKITTGFQQQHLLRHGDDRTRTTTTMHHLRRHQRLSFTHGVVNAVQLKASNHHHADASHDSFEKSSIQVGIAGAGSIAFATAAMLSRNGHEVMLWSPSGRGTVDLLDSSDNTPVVHATGAMVEEADYSFVPKIATTSRQLVQANSVVMICLPANGHKRVFDELAPHLAEACDSSEQRHVIISSHASLGALYLTRAIENEQEKRRFKHDDDDDSSKTTPIITAWGTTVCTARRRPSGKSVDIKSIRKSVDLCTLPEQESSSSSALMICQTLFPGITFQPRDGLLAISLSNLNPQNHLGMALGNMSRMDKGESWYQFQMTTPRIGKFLQDLDRERLDIADALGVEVKTIYEHFSLSFHVPTDSSISDMCQEIHKSGNDVYGPDTPFSRYVTEDVPFGLALTVALGRMVNRPAKLHESGILICNSMYGCDFEAENDLLLDLGLDEMTLEELQNVGRIIRPSQQLSSSSMR